MKKSQEILIEQISKSAEIKASQNGWRVLCKYGRKLAQEFFLAQPKKPCKKTVEKCSKIFVESYF